MAQPTIYADIDCDGQVEVKVNNDTGFACTIITSAGANDSVSSTGTDVYKYYNLTNSDWVKVVAAQDVTIAANKLTGTIKFGTFTTTSTTTAAPTTTTTAAPTTTTTAAPTTTTTAAPTTTTTTTPAGGGGTLPSGGASCASAVAWPGYGTGNKYDATITTTKQWFQADSSTRTIYSDTTATLYMEYNPPNNSCFPIAQTKLLPNIPYQLNSSGGEKFAIFVFAGTETCKIWLV